MSSRSPHRHLVVGHHYAHHSANSGYDRLAAHVSADYLDLTPVTVGRRYLGVPLGASARFVAEVLARQACRGRSLVHVIYPENLLGPLFSKGRRKLVVTLHHPFELYSGELWRNRMSRTIHRFIRQGLREADGIILLTPAEEGRFAAAFPRALVRVITHGVEDFSRLESVPRPDAARAFSICCVGHNYRDNGLVRDLVIAARDSQRPWQFHLVGMQQVGIQIAALSPHVTAHPRLDEHEYLRVVGGCDVNLLPLTHATANNALLEAHSVGTPSFVSSLPDVDVYCHEATVRFDGLADLMAKLDAVALNPPRRDDLRRRTIEGAKAFHWAAIARQVERFYADVEAGGH